VTEQTSPMEAWAGRHVIVLGITVREHLNSWLWDDNKFITPFLSPSFFLSPFPSFPTWQTDQGNELPTLMEE